MDTAESGERDRIRACGGFLWLSPCSCRKIPWARVGLMVLPLPSGRAAVAFGAEGDTLTRSSTRGMPRLCYRQLESW
jgi:hypothetical protein